MAKSVGHTATERRKKTIYTRQFFLLCLSNVLFFSSFNIIVAELPAYLEGMGGGDYKGLIISLFTLTAALSRPFSGRLADKVGRIPVMVFGATVCCIAAVLYPVLTTVAGFLFIRFFHGFSTGFTPTGISAYVADIVPIEKRGEAMGVLGFCGNLGMALGPAVGSEIAGYWTMEIMFYTSAVVSLLSVLLIMGMKETVTDREKFKWSHLSVRWQDVYDKSVVAPAIVMGLCLFPFGVLLTLIPDMSVDVGLQNKGVFFTVMVIASMSSRLFGGRLSDRFGRVPVLIYSSLGLAGALLCIAFATGSTQLLIGSGAYGLAGGLLTPTLFAWTIDLADPKHRGRGLGTVFIALEIGIGMGALSAGWIYDGSFEMFKYAFFVPCAMTLLGFIYLLTRPDKRVAD